MENKREYLLDIEDKLNIVSKIAVKHRKAIVDVIAVQQEELFNRLRYQRGEDANRIRDYLDWIDTLITQIMEAGKICERISKNLEKSDRLKWYNPNRYKSKDKSPEEILKGLEWNTL
jgi:hypothetical protein